MIIDFNTSKIKQMVVDEGAARKRDSFSSVNYDASGETIYFYNYYGEVIGTVDTTDFVIDGMIEDVYISGETLHIIFNTDSGKKDILVDLTEFFDPENYYTKQETIEVITTAIEAAIDQLEEFVVEQVESAITICTEYTDARMEEVQQSEEVISRALNALNDKDKEILEYVDDEVSFAITKANEYTDDAISSALTECYDYVDNVVSSAITECNEYTDEAIAAISGGTIDVDEHYDSGSTNAQSGIAVSEAIGTKQDKMVDRGLYPTVKDSGYLTGIFKQNGVLGYQSLTFARLRGWIVDDTTSVIDPNEPYKKTLIPNVQAVFDMINPINASGDTAVVYNTARTAGLLISGEYDSTVPRTVTKVGKMVNLTFQLKGDATANGANWTYIGTVQAPFRPIRQTPITVQVYNGTNNEAAGGTIYANGSIRVWTNAKVATNNYQIRCNVTYEGDWLRPN